VAAHTWYCNQETEEGVRLMLASKKDSNGGVAHQRMKKVAWGGGPAARTRVQPRRGEEAQWCSGFGDGGTTCSVSVMPRRRWPPTVWRRALATVEMKWLGGEGAVAPTRSSCGSDEIGELHESRAQRSADAKKLTTLLEPRQGRSLDAATTRRWKMAVPWEVASRLGSLTMQTKFHRD
jgi:hypothetical protein